MRHPAMPAYKKSPGWRVQALVPISRANPSFCVSPLPSHSDWGQMATSARGSVPRLACSLGRAAQGASRDGGGVGRAPAGPLHADKTRSPSSLYPSEKVAVTSRLPWAFVFFSVASEGTSPRHCGRPQIPGQTGVLNVFKKDQCAAWGPHVPTMTRRSPPLRTPAAGRGWGSRGDVSSLPARTLRRVCAGGPRPEGRTAGRHSWGVQN